MAKTELTERIAIVQHTREATAAALAATLEARSGPSSERDICDRWLASTAKTTSIAAEGWYQPPPGGACILIGHPDDGFARLNYDSLRTPATWSRDDISLDEASVIYAYASPFDRSTGLIGDIGLTLYRGDEQSIRDHLRTCFEVTTRIACHAEVGMELRELFAYAQLQIRGAELTNETSSTQSGATNIGHTVPWTYEEYSDEGQQCLERGDVQDIRDMISNNRVSINSSAALRIQPTMAITVEPQVSSPTAPLCSYHLIVTFSNGTRSISPSFKPLFEAFAMDEYLDAELARLS
jgi:hypothetical protein